MAPLIFFFVGIEEFFQSLVLLFLIIVEDLLVFSDQTLGLLSNEPDLINGEVLIKQGDYLDEVRQIAFDRGF